MPAATAAVRDGAAATVVLGFTVSGPDLDYAISGVWQILGVTVAEARAGIALGWGAGLRLPLAATLTLPAALDAGEEYTPTTALGGRDWSPADYAAVGLAAEDGNEFVLRYAFVVGAWAKIGPSPSSTGAWPTCALTPRAVLHPLGSGAAFPIPALDLGPDATGLQWDLCLRAQRWCRLRSRPGGRGQRQDHRQVAGGTLSGTLTYAPPACRSNSARWTPGRLRPVGRAKVQLSDFRYWFTQFLVKLGGYLQFDLFGYGTRSGTFSIAQLDLHDLTGGLYLGAHAGTGRHGRRRGRPQPRLHRRGAHRRSALAGRQPPRRRRHYGITDPDDPPVRARSALGPAPVAVTVTAITPGRAGRRPARRPGQAGAGGRLLWS